MLNRKNRTLSANLNRLNLGTRSLAGKVSANHGDQTLRIRPVDAFVMRDGMVGYAEDPMFIGICRIAAIPSSSVAVPRPSPVMRVVCPVERTVSDGTEFWSAITLGQPTSPSGPTQRQSQRPTPRGTSKPSRNLHVSKRLHSRRSAATTAVRATDGIAAAALSAASG